MNHQRHERRGLVILIVLSMLVLFLMMGATLLVLATRARTASRAFLAASDKSEAAAPILPRTILDEALLLLIRGSRDPGAEAIIRESLLGDMYGYTSTANATEKNRVPFRDASADTPALPASYGEPYDACDDRNPFLSQISSNGTVQRAAFQPAGGGAPSLQVDNDGDGVLDGLWHDGTSLFGNATSSQGSRLSFKVSYLVLDLDGRINVNAHGGSGTPALGPASIDLSDSGLAGIMGGNTLEYIRNGSTPSGGNGARSLAVVPKNLRQSPVLSGNRTGSYTVNRTIPGRGGEPYTLRLDSRATTQGNLTASGTFSLGELERVLRPFDSDWAALPPRLASMVNDLDGAARRSFTTDSWDVPFMTGLAAPPAGAAIRPKFDLTSEQWGLRPGGLDKNSTADKQTYARELYDEIRVIIPGTTSLNGTAQWCANVAEYWGYTGSGPAPQAMTGFPGVTGNFTGVQPSVIPDEAPKWSGGFVSAADLLAVPEGSKSDIEALIPAPPAVRLSPIVSLASKPDTQRILDAVAVSLPSKATASPFDATIQNEQKLLLKVGTGNQTIAVREPGRVNANTCSNATWTAVGGSGIRDRETVTMNSTWSVLKHGWDLPQPPGRTDDVTTYDRSRGHRLATIATVRSNVFAVWITLEVKDNGQDAGPPMLYRLFAIVDRSIPVNYARGMNTVRGHEGSNKPSSDATALRTTDVRDIIRLKRYLN